MEIQTEQTILAAVDLGSNSFHMVIAKLRDDHFQTVDKLKEMVQLRAGLDKRDRLSGPAQARALACLERFGQRIKDLPAGSVRVVGTNTLRVAKNSDAFLKKAKKALGHSIEIIEGEEEARLIYLGVAHALSFDNTRRLVMDIGGGSTEFIIGERFEGLQRESLSMGCVSFSQQFFAGGALSHERMKMAIIAAATRLRAIQKRYRDIGWDEAIGASGTIRCVASIVKEAGWAIDGTITLESLDKLIEVMISSGHMDSVDLAGLSDERRSVLPGGVAVLKASFEQLKIKQMTVSDGALREGLLYDLLGRISHDDERDHTVSAMARRYHADQEQTDRVVLMLDQLFDPIAKSWRFEPHHRQQLHWAANLHEIGLSIAHHQYQKHSYYLLAHSNLPGFSREEQYALAVIVRGQRRSFPTKYIKRMPKETQLVTQRLTVLLRLALVFNRGRSVVGATPVKIQATAKEVKLLLPVGWLAEHPLTEADLLQEVAYLQVADLRLTIREEA
jgi:exopolyphosphatase/guanosine-5'-triphosphate,3'-diphosphate pyrophosphatase